jgi:hypothetical protein
MKEKLVQIEGSLEPGTVLMDVKLGFLGAILPEGYTPRVRFRTEWNLLRGWRRQDGENKNAGNRYIRFSANLLNE